MIMLYKKLLKNNKGQSLTEAALVLPILLLLLMGALTIGMLVYTKMLMVLASSQGAKVGAYIAKDTAMSEGEKEQKIRTTALNYLGSGVKNVDTSNVQISYTSENIIVKVKYDYKITFPLVGDIFKNMTTVPLEYQSTYLLQ